MRSVGGLANEALGGTLGGAHGEPGTGKREPSRRPRRGKGAGEERGSSSSMTGATGRLDRSGQEKVIDETALTSNMEDMLALYGKMQQASIAFREKVKGVAERSGYLATTVRSVVVAHSKGDEVVADRTRAAKQLALAFEALGE